MNDNILPLISFYNSLENLQSINIWNIYKELDSINIEDDLKSKEKIIIERKVLNFNFNKGQLFSNSETTSIDGSVINKYSFTKDELEYLKERLQETSNNWLKSRYGHILWQQTKNNTFAEITLNSYFKLLSVIKEEEINEYLNILSAVFYITKKIKQGIDEAKKVSNDLLEILPNYTKSKLIERIIENNIYNIPELNIIANKIIDWFENDKPTSYFSNKHNLEIALVLFQKLKKSDEKIYELLALNEDFILEGHPNDEDFVKFTTMGTKAQYLKRAKKFNEYEQTLKEYNRLKQKIKLNKISVTLDDEHHDLFNKYLNIRTEAILELTSDQIFAFFSANEDILVNPKENIENAEKRYSNSFQKLFSTSTFDINSNFKLLNDSQKLDFEIIQSYAISHNITVYSLFLKVFIKGIICGKLNYYTAFEYLKENTWFGLKFKRNIALKKIDENASWLSLLAPGLHNLFSQFEFSTLMNTNKIGNYILSIDSLTIKFEGALQDFIRLSGGNTTVEKKGILQEQLLEELLENLTIKEFFSEKDIELFKFTFTKKGKNIRNNVAHSFMEFSDYDLQTAILIFFCILRLGKYTFE